MLALLCPLFTCTECTTVNIPGSIKSPLTKTTKVRFTSWKCVCLLDFTEKESFSMKHKLSAYNNNNNNALK